ncbi:MAG: ATP-binding protein, partial [Pseudomonadota bacterium]
DIWALGGKLRLQQVLVNIVNNGLEAMAEAKAPVIEIEVQQVDDAVQVLLRDHGPGLPQDSMDRVFDAFYTTKDAGVGMGLGMSISHNIISDFGGTLVAANHPEGGAVFTVTLQAHAGASA